jgi:N-acetylglucosamine-6-phosphate deacetylase
MITHLFNACGEDHHRRPGLAGIAMDDERLSCTLIPDGHHVHPIALRNAYRCLGSDRFVLVTDAVSAMGMPDGRYHLAGTAVNLQAGMVRNELGGLAGSAISMADAGENFLRWFPQLGPWSLAKAASMNPAKLIGANDWGGIAPGKRARFALLSGEGKLGPLDF